MLQTNNSPSPETLSQLLNLLIYDENHDDALWQREPVERALILALESFLSNDHQASRDYIAIAYAVEHLLCNELDYASHSERIVIDRDSLAWDTPDHYRYNISYGYREFEVYVTLNPPAISVIELSGF